MDSVTIDNMVKSGYKDISKTDAANYSVFAICPNSAINGDPFNNVKVRQAVMLYGVDWKALAKGLSQGYGEASLQLAPPGAYMRDEIIESSATFDLNKAKQLITEAGYANGFSTQINTTSAYANYAAAIQEALKALNITAPVNIVPDINAVRKDGKIPGFTISAMPSYLDHSDYLITYLNRDATTWRMITFSDDYMSIFNKMVKSTDMTEKIGLMKQLNRKLSVDECLIRPIFIQHTYNFQQAGYYDSGIAGTRFTPELTYYSGK